jgi:hypothetical protein
MRRNKAFRRNEREKHIKRKLYILKHACAAEPWKPAGYFDKNKIHCSCEQCQAGRKTNAKKGYTQSINRTGKNWKRKDIAHMLKEKDTYDET